MCDRERILAVLARQPSVSSAIAIGHFHVLNGAPLYCVLKGLDALESMPCGWTVLILKQAAMDPTRHPVVRRTAVTKIRRLLIGAVQRGYDRITEQRIHHRVRAAEVEAADPDGPRRARVISELCEHLVEALARGVFGRLPLE